MMVWIFNPHHWKIWKRVRPPELKKMDLENAVKRGYITTETINEEGAEAKVIQIEETLVIMIATKEETGILIETINSRESIEITPLPLFLEYNIIRTFRFARQNLEIKLFI